MPPHLYWDGHRARVARARTPTLHKLLPQVGVTAGIAKYHKYGIHTR